MKLVSKFTVGISPGLHVGINAPLGYLCRIMRIYALKPEVLVCGMVVAVILFYIQAIDVWSRALLGKIQYTLGRTTKVRTSKIISLLSHYYLDNGLNI